MEISVQVPNTRFLIRSMKVDDIKESTKVVQLAFHTPTEPTGYYLYLDKALDQLYIETEMSINLKDGMCLVCVDLEKDSEIVGVLVAGDYEDEIKGRSPCEKRKKLNEKIKDIEGFRILEYLVEIMNHQLFRICEEKKITNVLHVGSVAVSARARGNGIMRAFLDVILEIAIEREYEIIFAFCTNVFSIRVFQRKFRFCESWFDVWYDKFEFGEKQIKPYFGCNQVALEFLKKKGKYKEELKDDICTRCSVLVTYVNKEKS